jgi:hypothetical protein
LEFSRRGSLDAESMDVVLHHITERIIDQAMPLDEGLVLKRGSDNVHDEMAAAGGGTGVAGMFGTFVDNFQ